MTASGYAAKVIAHPPSEGKRFAWGNRLLPGLGNALASGLGYPGTMDEMLRIPKDRPKRNPLMLVALMAVTGLIVLVLTLR